MSRLFRVSTRKIKTANYKNFLASLYLGKVVSYRHAGEEAGGSRRPSGLSVEGAGGAKVHFLNAMICFLIGNMIQRRSYKPKASNI